MDRDDEILGLRLSGLSYAEIARAVGLSRQRVQQILAPPKAIRDQVVIRANGKCERCGIVVGRSGQVHHGSPKHQDGDWYNDVERLQLLCVSCHIQVHSALKRLGGDGQPYPKGASVQVRVLDAQGVDIKLVAEYLRRALSDVGISTHKDSSAP